MMEYIAKFIELGTVTMGENPRLPTTLELPALKQSISDNGLLEPITVWEPNGDGAREVIKGHRRTMALVQLADENPKRFKELFPEGIPAFIRENITAKEATVLKLDHGGQLSLSHPYELQMSANQLFAHKATQAEVANLLRPLIDKISPPPANKKQEFSELQEGIDTASDAKARSKAEKALYERIADYHRGRVQGLFDIYRCPALVDAALYFKACGIRRKGFEEPEYLPSLTQKQVNSLWKEFSEDLKIEEDGVPKYNAERPGPNFVKKWDEICKAEKSKEPAVPKAKSMSATDMKEEIGTRWASAGFCKLTKWHSGDKAVDGLDGLDKAYHGLDLVMKYSLDLAAMVAEEAVKIKKQLIEADKAAEAEAVAPEEVAAEAIKS